MRLSPTTPETAAACRDQPIVPTRLPLIAWEAGPETPETAAACDPKVSLTLRLAATTRKAVYGPFAWPVERCQSQGCAPMTI